MKATTFLILCGLLISIYETRGQKLKNSEAYFQSASKVGILVTPLVSAGQSNVSGGLIGAAVSSNKPTSKYHEALKVVAPPLNPSNKIIELFKEIYEQKGKSVTVITDRLDSLNLKEFEAPKTGKKYFEKDLRFLKEKFQVDEIMIVFVVYGIHSTYSYGIEAARLGMCTIQTEIINLNDNSFVMREETIASEKIGGKARGDWDTPPAYENVRTSISAAIEKAIASEKDKYKNLGK